MSQTDVSPSTLTLLNVYLTASLSIFLRRSASISASVVKMPIIVARLGWIIPEPFAWPAILMVRSSASVISADTSLGTVSVVIIAYSLLCAVSSDEDRPLTSSGIAAEIRSKGSLDPITPVEAVRISSEEHPSSLATVPAIKSASSIPALPTAAFAFLLLTMMPLTFFLLSIIPMERTSECPFTRLDVYTPATVQGVSDATSPTSR